jgi:hypothetical protein
MPPKPAPAWNRRSRNFPWVLLPPVKGSLIDCCPLLIDYCLSLIDYCPLLIDYCPLLIDHCPLLITALCWLITVLCWLIIALYWLIAALCWLITALCWLITALCWLITALCDWLLAFVQELQSRTRWLSCGPCFTSSCLSSLTLTTSSRLLFRLSELWNLLTFDRYGFF